MRPATRGTRHWAADTKTRNGYAAPATSYPPGTTASKIHIAAGLIVPEDAADCFTGTDPGTVIPHALRLGSYCASNQHYPPAYGADGRQPNGIPMGARVQLDPAIDVTKWPSVIDWNHWTGA